MTCHSEGIEQTLFLGASIADFNLNMGWGGQPSQLTVTLIEDRCPGSSGGDNGSTTASSGAPAKRYYNTDINNGIVSAIHYGNDPGFIGIDNDIINAAYLFKIGAVEFIGVVKSWERSTSSAGIIYTVNMDSIDYILDHSCIICNKYTGTIFTAASSGATYGGPFNYTGSSGFSYKGNFNQGAFPNVFNVYGFLESGGFGGSARNDRGIPAYLIKDALSILTSTEIASNAPVAFSPFGRIILKSGTGNGMLYLSPDANNVNRCCCILDLSELSSTPSDFRINADTMTINEFVSTVSDAVGCDFYWKTMLHITSDTNSSNKPYVVLKLKTRSRRLQLNTNFLQNQLSSGNITDASSIIIGKEKNNITNRTMIIGANQQRLYQASSARLSFGQSNYIWHPISGTFIDYKQYSRGWAKLPTGISVRNPYLTYSSSAYNAIVTSQQNIQNIYTDFDTDGNYYSYTDDWSIPSAIGPNGADLPVVNPPPSTNAFSKIFPSPDGVRSGWSGTSTARYMPLYWDMIFPFFGFIGKEEATPEPNSTSINPNFNRIRPCFMDLWTNNIVIPIYSIELPLNLQARFTGAFLVTESEIRAATSGWESYLAYCMAKIYKPDLYTALLAWYKGNLTPQSAGDMKDKTANNTPNSDEQDQDITGNINIANNLGYIAGNGGTPNPQMSIDLSFIINPDLLRDFIKISEYIAGFGKYYGKSYMIRLPKVDGYRDMSNSSFTVTDSNTDGVDYANDVVGYRGSGKTFFNFEPAPDGGWEEYGNYINNDILIGSGKWYALINDDGKIPPILGYNAGTSVDWIQKAICGMTIDTNYYNPNLIALHSVLSNAFVAENRSYQTGPGPSGNMNPTPTA